MAIITVGKFRVWGIPPVIKQIGGIPPGAKVRLRFRAGQPAKVFVRVGGQITAHYITTDTNLASGDWVLMRGG
jgi:hypothetical protein